MCSGIGHPAIVERARWKNILFPVLTQLLPTLAVSFLSAFACQQELTFEDADLIMFLLIRSLWAGRQQLCWAF